MRSPGGDLGGYLDQKNSEYRRTMNIYVIQNINCMYITSLNNHLKRPFRTLVKKKAAQR